MTIWTATEDARSTSVRDQSVDLVVTSPPYWRKRDYRLEGQIGQETTPQEYISSLVDCLREWDRVLRPSRSIFLNIGDTYIKRSLVGIPFMLESQARSEGWIVRNRIIWSKIGGTPDPARDRLTPRHEYVLHLTKKKYYYDLDGYTEVFGTTGANPGDVWQISSPRNGGRHLAPFPRELAERAILLGCPREVCSICGKARERISNRTSQLDPSRPQAKRAMELARDAELTEEHFAAIRAVGISDAGKAIEMQTGSGRNSDVVHELASEAKDVLGGYFREFTFGKRVTTGWTNCECQAPYSKGIVLDPFVGTGTTLKAAHKLGLDSVGIDLSLDCCDLSLEANSDA